jgi:hypothetical protein
MGSPLSQQHVHMHMAAPAAANGGVTDVAGELIETIRR